MKRIFVQIVSYRDPECHHTLTDMFEKAAHPERITVGLCWQYDPAEDAAFVAVPYPCADQVKVVQYHVKDAQGAGWARVEAQKLWAGEEYVLQIQAHHRFEKNWDETLIAMLESLPKRSVLTAWLPGYQPPFKKEPLKDKFPIATINRLGDEQDAQFIHLIKKLVPKDTYKEPFITAMWVGNFLFARAEAMQEVPSDPLIFFWGEELNLSARLWTHGYDIYHLPKVVLYHYWDRKDVKGEDNYRDLRVARNKRSLARNLHLLGLEKTKDKEALKDLDKYALGKTRSLAEYFSFIGVDLNEGTIAPFAKRGEFTPAKKPEIFISVASYRDKELTPTVADAFAKATYPERIRVGICQQVGKEDKDCAFETDRPSQVKIEKVDPRESKGANWARAKAMGLHAAEEYILQIDSHMRFETGWDEALIDMLARCPAEKPVISAYLPNYTPPDARDTSPGYILRMKVRRLGEENDPQLVHLTGEFAPLTGEQGGLYPTPFIIANFMFARADIWKQVPIDPYIYFHGDEISLSARLWTHGMEVFQPDKTVCFHYWAREGELAKHPYRSPKQPQAQVSRQRNQHLLGVQKTDNNTILAELEHYGLGDARNLSSFWAFAGVDLIQRKVSEKANKGLWSDMKAVKKTDKPRIFVQIASYRDPDCQHTVKDMFDKATYPERINVGICWQFVKEEDGICFQVPYPYPDQVRVIEIDAKKGRGVCWARSLTQTLWEGEEFIFQIDSHMRFEPGWDETLIRMYNEVGGGKSVITCYPPGFTPPDKFERNWFFGMSAKEFDAHGIFIMTGKPAFTRDNAPPKPIPGAFASANMLFGPSSIIQDVPYDPHLYFFGEEISLAVRLWTQGYDIYHPNCILIFHDWDRGKRPTHFADHDKTWWNQNLQSFARVKHMLGTEISTDKEVLVEFEKYGLGKVRSLEEYQRFSGVDFTAKTFSDDAANGKFAVPQPSMQHGPEVVQTSCSLVQNGKIFVRIASYRDRECQWTVKDLFEKASRPDRIKVGICWQFDEKQDANCFEVVTRPDQVQVIPNDWRDSEGVCWARSQAEMLLEDEEYTLQIDSHMRFVPGWDDLLIAELAACGNKKAVISCSPAKYTPPNNLDSDTHPTVRRVLPFTASGNLRGRGEMLEVDPETPLKGAFVAAGFMFSRSELLRDVPYDPYLYFDQEEIMYALRLYTHGWDVYSARKQYLYHYYNDPLHTNHPLHWKDFETSNPEKLQFLSARGLSRFNHLTGYKESQDSRTLTDLDKYGLGKARTLAEFEAFTGIDFKKKIAHPKALQCGFIENLSRYRQSPIIADGSAASHVQASGSKYEAGDVLPYFIVDDTHGHQRPIEKNAGRPMLFFYLTFNDHEHNAAFFKALHDELKKAGKMPCSLAFMMDAPIAALMQFKERTKLPHIFWADGERKIANLLGIGEGATCFLLSANLQIKQRYENMEPSELAKEAVADMAALTKPSKEGKPVEQAAPVLIVPELLSPELCDELIAAFKGGDTFSGEVGNKGYVPTAKERKDFIVPESLRKQIDLKLSRSLFPEIEKIFGFKVAGRENYKIGLYSGEAGGFFSVHRDNFEPELGYRRIAMTLHLSDDYEGGGLSFPEYDNRIYRPTRGSAIAFSGSMLHEAHKVTKGERYILVGFFHGEEEEAYRQHFLAHQNAPLLAEEFKPLVHELSGLERSRDFYRRWKEQAKPKPAADLVLAPSTGFVRTPAFAVGRSRHQPIKVSESRAGVVYDNFLPEDMYNQLQNFCHISEYEHINTKGPVSRAWHVHDGFPLRSTLNTFYHPDKAAIPNPKPHYIFPTGTGFDPFMEFMTEFAPQVEAYVGKSIVDWGHFSATAWLYPPGTGLAMHDDGSGVYSGAYAYFLNKTWRAHWGGMLLLLDDAGNDAIHAHRRTIDQIEYHHQKWLHVNNVDDLMLDHGLARCIFPKGNRMVFINNEAYHMVTRVNEMAGDNIRLSIAGFFNRKKG